MSVLHSAPKETNGLAPRKNLATMQFKCYDCEKTGKGVLGCTKCDRITCNECGIADKNLFVSDYEKPQWVLCSAHMHECKVCESKVKIDPNEIDYCDNCEKWVCVNCISRCSNDDCFKGNLNFKCHDCGETCEFCDKFFCNYCITDRENGDFSCEECHIINNVSEEEEEEEEEELIDLERELAVIQESIKEKKRKLKKLKKKGKKLKRKISEENELEPKKKKRKR